MYRIIITLNEGINEHYASAYARELMDGSDDFASVELVSSVKLITTED